jgi:hypothetical protein
MVHAALDAKRKREAIDSNMKFTSCRGLLKDRKQSSEPFHLGKFILLALSSQRSLDPTPMRIAVLRATPVLTSGCEKNAKISVLMRRVHPLRKRNSKIGFGRVWENVAPTEMAKSELAARFRDISACC